MSMISDLVDRLRVESKAMGKYGNDYMATLLMKSADTIKMLSEKAREPKQGEWIYDDKGHFRCSKCGCYPSYQNASTDFCPNCGAKMRGWLDDEN